MPANTDLVLIEAGSADLCGASIQHVSDMLSAAVFRAAVDQALANIVARLGANGRIQMQSIPNWPQLRSLVKPRPSYACPALFANNDPQFAQRLADYNSQLQGSCEAVAGGRCRWDGGLVNSLVLTEDDVTTIDYFHPSKGGQAKIANAAWRSGWWSTTTLPPLNPTAAPPKVVTSSYRVGTQLFADAGVWNLFPRPANYLSYQWRRCKLYPFTSCIPIPGATGQTYTLTSSDLVFNDANVDFLFGVRVMVAVSATSGAGSASASSRLDAALPAVNPAAVGGSTQTFGAPTGDVAPPFPNPIGIFFKIGGNFSLPERGTITSFSMYMAGGGSPQTFTPAVYGVDQNGVPTTLVVTAAPVTIAAGRPGGWVSSALSVPILLDMGVYSLAYVAHGTDRGAVPYYYIPGASIGWVNSNKAENGDLSLIPSNPFGAIEHLAGEYPAVYVSYAPASSGGSPTAPANTLAPSISGTTEQGQTLTADPGSWTGTAPITFSYQWQRCDAAGASCGNVGPNSQVYTLTGGDLGSRLKVTVTASNSVSSTAATSGLTGVIGAPNPPVSTSLPTISGTAQAGQTLTAGTGGWTGSSPISYAYQWQRCDTGGAGCAGVGAGASYLLGAADVGSRLKVTVTASNGVGSASATSALTGVVAAASTGGGGGSLVPDLTVSGTAEPASAAVGDSIVYRVQAGNKNGALASNVVVTATLPANVALVSATADRGPGCAGTTTLRCNLDFLSGGAPVGTIVITVRAGAPGEARLSLSISSDQGDSSPGDNQTSISATVRAPASLVPPPARPVLERLGAAPRTLQARPRGAAKSIAAALRVANATTLSVTVSPAGKTRLLSLLKGSKVGKLTTRRALKTIVVRPGAAATTQTLSLLLSRTALKPGGRYVVTATARSALGVKTLLIPVRG